ncbi:THUMP domain-containing 1 [Brachionus plicatilis]|uniref:THUMP domain-containing 1 n=1 Tax=Brachionus plicatilis TaxID=10195 RepID=A0A3M7QF94_BRAPC|nr:THUMP domain-containing 1 [Brachionus plicatilis]
MGNKRKYYANSQKSNKKSKYMFDEKVQLGPNMKGFLITYNCKFTFLINEARKLIQQFSGEMEVQSADKSDDIEKQLQQELNSLHTLDKKMSILDPGAKYTIFINQPDLDPNQVVGSIFGHVEKTKKSIGRYVQRFLPVLNTCRSYLEDLETCLISTLDELDPIKSCSETEAESKPFKYCCVFKTSNNNVLSRDLVFTKIGAYLQSKNKQNKVDFDNPDYVIIINVICNLCYISFVDKYFENKKYNLIEMGAKFNKTEKVTLAKIETQDTKKENA